MEDILVPIFLCVVLPVSIVFICCFLNYRKKKARYETISKAIEKGVEIDPALLMDSQGETNRKKNSFALFTWGIVLTLLGIAILIGTEVPSLMLDDFAFSGLIPLSIGLGLLIAFFAGRYFKKKDADKE